MIRITTVAMVPMRSWSFVRTRHAPRTSSLVETAAAFPYIGSVTATMTAMTRRTRIQNDVRQFNVGLISSVAQVVVSVSSSRMYAMGRTTAMTLQMKKVAQPMKAHVIQAINSDALRPESAFRWLGNATGRRTARTGAMNRRPPVATSPISARRTTSDATTNDAYLT